MAPLLTVRVNEKANLLGKILVKMTNYSSFASVKKYEISYGHKEEKYVMIYFWNLVLRDFVEYRSCLPYVAEICRKVEKSKAR